MNREESHKFYKDKLNQAKELSEQYNEDYVKEVMRGLAKSDLFFLLVYVLKRKDADRDFVYDRCREYEASPNSHIDLWAREHYKSTIITFARTIQEILIDPNITIGIFSFKVSIAIDALKQIRREFEENELLRTLFPEIIWEKPSSQSPVWHESAIIVKRSANPKEATIEAHAIESLPTGKHFRILIFDDIVKEDSCNTAEMTNKITTQFELALSLSSDGGKVRIIGTRYALYDTYAIILDGGIFKPRIYPATLDGKPDGEPRFFTKEYLDFKRSTQSPYVFSCQYLQNPNANSIIKFNPDWIRYIDRYKKERLNTYILVDPASSRKKKTTRLDYTAMIVIGLGEDQNYYVLDIVRDRLSLTQKAEILFELHRKYQPIKVGYEQYGLQADIEHMNYVMKQETYHFKIEELGGKVSKEDRIVKLMPLFEAGRIFLPGQCNRINVDGYSEDLTKIFINEEYLQFPTGKHDDMLDILSRVVDPEFKAKFPSARGKSYCIAESETEYESDY